MIPLDFGTRQTYLDVGEVVGELEEDDEKLVVLGCMS